jgi:hypothetical protein
MTNAFDVMTLRHGFNIVTDVGRTSLRIINTIHLYSVKWTFFHQRLSCILSNVEGLVGVQAPTAVPVVNAPVQIRRGLIKALVERTVVTKKTTI